ncbi:Methionine synthase [Lentibacillus sp. JNUCC-1]|uniref:cobalamin B12-binding domain-containing protein n=1 Tax=Lentibacillus sp. JNUCC-1 TaxID=2654513 RepID=UPI001325456D|nr:cobalamin-dependent protein [Lentibacillus sp. JNUCC-1]MUV37742.1 Methionine synthase [Lentibacillus sp. JNUCC-1]
MNEYAQELVHYLLRGNDEEAINYITEIINDQNHVSLYETLITPAMHHIGKLWESNQISVADEHLATATCDFVITTIEAQWLQTGESNDKKVMLFGVEEEEHYLGLKMVATVFRENGWNVRYMGPNLPFRHAKTAIEIWKPDVVGVSAALSYRLPKLLETIEQLQEIEHQPDIILGGQAVGHYHVPPEAANQVFAMRNLTELQSWLQQDRKGEKNIDFTP